VHSLFHKRVSGSQDPVYAIKGGFSGLLKINFCYLNQWFVCFCAKNKIAYMGIWHMHCCICTISPDAWIHHCSGAVALTKRPTGMTNNNNEQVPCERHRVSVAHASQSFIASENINLLVNMERANQSHVLVGCRGGGCGKCRIQVLEGTYLSKKMSRAHIKPDDEEQGVVLACRIFARSDLHIIPMAVDQH
jgi:ferredoxin